MPRSGIRSTSAPSTSGRSVSAATGRGKNGATSPSSRSRRRGSATTEQVETGATPAASKPPRRGSATTQRGKNGVTSAPSTSRRGQLAATEQGANGATPAASKPPRRGSATTERGAEGATVDRAEETLSIGELAQRTNVSTRTIRYYEELGILVEPERTAGGTRRYPTDYIFYVEGAKILKQLGFGLEEIAELGKFALTGASASKRTRAILQEKLKELNHRIRVLNRLHELVVEASAEPKSNEAPAPELLRWVSEENGTRTGRGD